MGNMKRKLLLLASLVLLAAAPLAAQSSFALYFNSDRTRITTMIIYNETSRPLSIGVNGGMDWAMDDGESTDGGDEKTASLLPGDLTSLRKNFMTGDCILIESESDGVFLAMNSDRDSVYVYARDGGGETKVVREK